MKINQKKSDKPDTICQCIIVKSVVTSSIFYHQGILILPGFYKRKKLQF